MTDQFKALVVDQREDRFSVSVRELDIEAPYRLSFSWDTEGWIVSFVLKETESGDTEFTLIHGGWKEPEAVINKVNRKSSEIHSTMDQGWNGLVNTKLRGAVEA